MTIADLNHFHRSQGWLDTSPQVEMPLTEELDRLAEKLQQQQELNTSLMCEVKRLQNENSRLVRMVRRFDVTSL